MSPFKANPSLFVRALVALMLLIGIGFATWLIATPGLHAASQLVLLDFHQPDRQSTAEPEEDR